MKFPPDHVQIRPAHRSKKLPALIVRLGDGDVNYNGGVGGWEAVARPRRRPLTVWRGPQNPLTYPLPLLFDRFLHGKEGESVEADVRLLEKMAGLDEGTPEPPVLIVEGALPHDASRAPDNRWVIADISWGDTIRRKSDGHRVRVACVVTFLLHEADDRLSRVTPPKQPKWRSYTVKKGDTYNKIAAAELGTKRLGTRLAQVNGGRSPDVAPKRKQLLLPTGRELESWKSALKKR